MTPKIGSIIEKRKFPRLESSLPAFIKNEYLDIKESTCKNISESGVCLEVELNNINEKALWVINNKESKINIEISLVNGKEKVNATAVVRWCKGKSFPDSKKLNLGMEFVEIDTTARNRIASFITENLPKKSIGEEAERVPHDAKLNYAKDFIESRREWLSKKTGTDFSHISYYSSEAEEFRGNIENFVGVAQVPIGIVGPLVIKGDYANGIFYVPFATTEGALVETYQRGARIRFNNMPIYS